MTPASVLAQVVVALRGTTTGGGGGGEGGMGGDRTEQAQARVHQPVQQAVSINGKI